MDVIATEEAAGPGAVLPNASSPAAAIHRSMACYN